MEKELGVRGDAILSTDGKYRYFLTRWWDPNRPIVLFIMLNPSKADATRNDPTIRMVIEFSKIWGFGSLGVLNLFAARASDFRDLNKISDPVGPENRDHIMREVRQFHSLGAHLVCAWGANGGWMEQSETVLGWIEKFCSSEWVVEPLSTSVLGFTKGGHPRHPLYLPKTTPLIPWNPWQEGEKTYGN